MKRNLGESYEDFRKRRMIENVIDKQYLNGRMFHYSRVITKKEGDKLTGYTQTYRKEAVK